MPIIGVMTIAVMLGVIWYWEIYGRELYFYQEIVVLNQDINRGTIITEDMLTNQKIEANFLINQVIKDKNTILKLEAKQFIPKSAQLHPNFFEKTDLSTGGNTYIVRIPNEWLYSVPNTLRRKDHVLFYQINEHKFGELNKVLEASQEAEDNSIQTYLPEQTENLKETVSNRLLETTVAYVKDGVNREVITVSAQDRIDGSSVIAEVMVFLRPEQLQSLEQVVNDGGKFIIMYDEGGN